jgi:hypothetical protein
MLSYVPAPSTSESYRNLVARLQTKGFELGYLGTSAPDGLTITAATPALSISTAQPRSGSRSLFMPVATSGGSNNAYLTQAGVTGVTYSWRSYVYLTGFPPSGQAVNFLAITTSGDVGIVVLQIDSTGNLTFINNAASTTIGTGTITLNTWYRVEISIKIDTTTAANATAECQINGVSIGSTTGSLGTTLPSRYKYNGDNQPSGGLSYYVDDVALNDSTGTSQTSWPGSGKVVLLVPTSDNARTGFTGGAGGTTSLFDGVDNIPPVGAADPGTNTSQIRDATSSATDNYDANMTTYSAAGIGAGDTISLVYWMISHSTASLTSVPTRAGRLVSNPAEGADTTLTLPSAVAGAWAVGWATDRGAMIYNPTVTLGTAPVLRVGKRTASTRIVDVAFMGIYVEYVPAAPKSLIYADRRVARNALLRR